MRILIVEDENDLAEFLKSGLEAEVFSVDIANDGEKGSFLAKTNDYDLVILDINLPSKSGADICKEIREKGKTVPVLMLTVKDDVESKVSLLNMGADDYLTKPFSFQELLARVKALLRRPQSMTGDILTIDDLQMDLSRHVVTRGEMEIRLTRKEFQLLEYLLRCKGNVVTRGMILEHVWDMSGDIFSNTIETHVSNLRRKIDLPGKKELIRTVSGMGYKIG